MSRQFKRQKTILFQTSTVFDILEITFLNKLEIFFFLAHI